MNTTREHFASKFEGITDRRPYVRPELFATQDYANPGHCNHCGLNMVNGEVEGEGYHAFTGRKACAPATL